MKVAFAIDFLLERTPEVFLLELLLQGFEDAEIYTLAHAPGKILGRIETHRIHSSPLSRLISSGKKLSELAWMVPGAAKQLTSASDVDKLIIISSGWAHTIESSGKTERYVWLYDFNPKQLRLKGWRKFFGFYHQDFKFKALEREKHRAFASFELEKLLGHEGAPIIYPGFKTEDYHLVPDDQHPGLYSHHLVILNEAEPAMVREFFKLTAERNIPVKCVGRDEQYESEKKNFSHVEFIGDHCAATTAALTHGARATWVFAETNFPVSAFGSLCCGRPVVVRDTPLHREVLKEGVWFMDRPLAELLETVERDYLSPDKKLLRRTGLKYNERLFKNQIRLWSGIKPSKSEE